jgi:hypothetical protein
LLRIQFSTSHFCGFSNIEEDFGNTAGIPTGLIFVEVTVWLAW